MCEESTHNQWLCDSDTNSKLLIPGQNIDAKTEEEDEERKKNTTNFDDAEQWQY